MVGNSEESGAGREAGMNAVMRLYETISVLLGYVAHDTTCEVHMTEFCTCGMKQAKEDAKSAFNAAKKFLTAA